MKKSEAISQKDANELRENVEDAKKDETMCTMRLAELLYNVMFSTVMVNKKEVDVAVAWGFDDFDDYCEREVEIHMSKAHGLVRVYDELIVRRDLNQNQLPNSITKLRELAKVSHRVTNKSDLNEWIKKAEKMSCCELQNAVDEAFGERGKRRNWSVYMKWNQIRPMVKQIDQAKVAFGVTTNGEALSQIVTQWAEMREVPAVRKLYAVK